MKPTIGRIVHYNTVATLGTTHAAIVIDVHEDETVDLQVWFRDGSIDMRENVEQGDQACQWQWPPRV